MSSSGGEDETAGDAGGENNEMSSLLIYCLQSDPRALIVPFLEADNPLLVNFEHPAMKKAQFVLDGVVPEDDACEINFAGSGLWNDMEGAKSVLSRHVAMDILQGMKRHGKTFLCSADLYCSHSTAGTLFFIAEDTDNSQQETACISFHNRDKIRLMKLPEEESLMVAEVIRANWKFGTVNENYDKYGVPEYKLREHPWVTAETSNEHNLEARKLMIGLLRMMSTYGWTKVVPFDVSVRNASTGIDTGDTDSLVFYREPDNKERADNKDFCCISLERSHKIRLIGADCEATEKALQSAINLSWKMGIIDTSHYEGSYQIKVRGSPWFTSSTAEAIAGASLMCEVVQTLWETGWKWHCSIDMTKSLSDKSTFFFQRDKQWSSKDADDDDDSGIVACLQPMSYQKLNFVRFPSHLLPQMIDELKASSWAKSIDEAKMDDALHGTIKFSDTIHLFHNNDHSARTSRLYNHIISRILKHPGAKFLGCGDIWACPHGDEEVSEMGMDVFFFSFSAEDYETGSLRSLV